MRADIVIRTLRERGVEISIDDYGTGNASLGYLKRLEIDELKIDRSFVSNIGRDDHDLIIVRSTIELALALGLARGRRGHRGRADRRRAAGVRCRRSGRATTWAGPVLPETIEATARCSARRAYAAPGRRGD